MRAPSSSSNIYGDYLMYLTDSGSLKGKSCDRDEVTILLVPQAPHFRPGEVKCAHACQCAPKAVACRPRWRLRHLHRVPATYPQGQAMLPLS